MGFMGRFQAKVEAHVMCTVCVVVVVLLYVLFLIDRHLFLWLFIVHYV